MKKMLHIPQKIISKVLLYSKNNPYLLFLIIFVVAARLPVLVDRLIPFQFDHGKDAIGTFHMWQTFSPKLIGPWTSIPGLFFGPAWYYMLLPGMVLTNGDPVASVITMILIGLLTIVVTYRSFGRTTATLLATSSLFYTITTSAWNPFPMVGVSIVLLAVLQHVEKAKKITGVTAALLGFFSALGFHFSTAFAIFYPILIILSLLFKKIRISSKIVITALIAFIIPFIPQILFEISHNFIEVKGVLAYLQNGDSDPASLNKFQNVLHVTWGELQSIILPPSYFELPLINHIIFFSFALLLVFGLVFYFRHPKKQQFPLSKDAALWFTLPLLAFTFLHFNLWYVLPLAAFTFIVLGTFLDQTNALVRRAFLVLCFISAITKVVFYIQTDKDSLLAGTTFLPIKEQAIEYIYEQTEGKPFASYQYMPDIYDYPYQYLYFKSALNGEILPTEFSYKPGETAYIPEKAELLQKFSKMQTSQSPEIIFYIVEDSDNPNLLESWWSQQKYGEIVDKQDISDVVTVYTATPATN